MTLNYTIIIEIPKYKGANSNNITVQQVSLNYANSKQSCFPYSTVI